MKKLITIILFSAVFFLLGVKSYADSNIRIKVNGNDVNFVDQQPVVENNRTLVPVRFVSEDLGFKVDWDGATQKVTISKDSKAVELTIGSNVATVNGKAITLDATTTTIGDRTMVPLRFVSEQLNCTVDWFSKNNIAAINSKDSNGRAIRMIDRFMQSEEYTKNTYDSGTVKLTPKDTSLNYYILQVAPYKQNGKGVLITDGSIEVSIPDKRTRAAVREAVKVMSPVNGERIYMYLVCNMRGEVFEGFGIESGYPMVKDYLDGRNVKTFNTPDGNTFVEFSLEGKRFPPFARAESGISKLMGVIHKDSYTAFIEDYEITEYTQEDYKRVREKEFWDYFLKYFKENIEYFNARGVRCYDPRYDTNAAQEYRDARASYPTLAN